jgi:ketosteroid isomerase-like protein
MNKLILFISVLLFTSCSGSSKNEQAKEEVLSEEEVMTLINKFDQAFTNNDATTVDSLISERYVYFTQSGNTFNRQQLVATAASDEYLLQNMQRENIVVHLDGNTAVVSTIWKGQGVYHGEQFNDRQRCSVTIVKHKGQVKILAEHCTPIKK